MAKLQYLQYDDTVVCHNCDYLKSSTATVEARTEITFPTVIWERWQTASRVHPNLEILALFNVNADGVVTELVIPPQKIEVASCTLTEQNGHFDGLIHSHHKMAPNFSPMDRETALPNYTYNVVTSHDDGCNGVVRVTLPCGGLGFKKLSIFIEEAPADAALREHVLAMCTTPAAKQATTRVTSLVDTPFARSWEDIKAWDSDYLPYEHASGNGSAAVAEDVYPGCPTCEVWYDEDPTENACVFCNRTLVPVHEEKITRDNWEEVSMVLDQMYDEDMDHPKG
jgi:hypothetical protein